MRWLVLELIFMQNRHSIPSQDQQSLENGSERTKNEIELQKKRYHCWFGCFKQVHCLQHSTPSSCLPFLWRLITKKTNSFHHNRISQLLFVSFSPRDGVIPAAQSRLLTQISNLTGTTTITCKELSDLELLEERLVWQILCRQKGFIIWCLVLFCGCKSFLLGFRLLFLFVIETFFSRCHDCSCFFSLFFGVWKMWQSLSLSSDPITIRFHDSPKTRPFFSLGKAREMEGIVIECLLQELLSHFIMISQQKKNNSVSLNEFVLFCFLFSFVLLFSFVWLIWTCRFFSEQVIKSGEFCFVNSCLRLRSKNQNKKDLFLFFALFSFGFPSVRRLLSKQKQEFFSTQQQIQEKYTLFFSLLIGQYLRFFGFVLLGEKLFWSWNVLTSWHQNVDNNSFVTKPLDWLAVTFQPLTKELENFYNRCVCPDWALQSDQIKTLTERGRNWFLLPFHSSKRLKTNSLSHTTFFSDHVNLYQTCKTKECLCNRTGGLTAWSERELKLGEPKPNSQDHGITHSSKPPQSSWK